jgi:hypothetical protein
MITNKNFNDIQSQMNDNGLVIVVGKPAARKFTGEQQGLAEGKYTPLVEGGMPANDQIVRSGNHFAALAFKNEKGTTIQIGVNGITSTIMVLDAATDATKWDGKASAKAFYRFGKLSDIGLTENQREITNGTDKTTLYDAQPFALKKRVQYIVPEFEDFVRPDGTPGRRPVYKAGCAIRTVWAVEDYDKFPGAGNNTTLPVAE